MFCEYQIFQLSVDFSLYSMSHRSVFGVSDLFTQNQGGSNSLLKVLSYYQIGHSQPVYFYPSHKVSLPRNTSRLVVSYFLGDLILRSPQFVPPTFYSEACLSLPLHVSRVCDNESSNTSSCSDVSLFIVSI